MFVLVAVYEFTIVLNNLVVSYLRPYPHFYIAMYIMSSFRVAFPCSGMHFSSFCCSKECFNVRTLVFYQLLACEPSCGTQYLFWYNTCSGERVPFMFLHVFGALQ